MDKKIIYYFLGGVFVTSVLIFSSTSCSRYKETNVQMKRDHIIVDKLQNAEDYYHMHPAFEKAFVFLRQDDLAKLTAERHEIDGDHLFCIISKSPGRSRSEAKLEAHRKYIDIQYVIAGTDEMGFRPTADCKFIETSYDAEKDIEFFKEIIWNYRFDRGCLEGFVTNHFYLPFCQSAVTSTGRG